MTFIQQKGTATATHEMSAEEKQGLEEDSPANYERALQKVDKDTQEQMERDERKLKIETKKIAKLQREITKKEKKYAETEQLLAKEEIIEAVLEDERLKKAEEKLAKLKEGCHTESPVVEKIEEVLNEVKEGVNHMLEYVVHLAHITNADEKEPTAHRRTLANMDEWSENFSIDEFVADEAANSKEHEKLKALSNVINDLRREIAEKRKTILTEDDEILRRKKLVIDRLRLQLEDEERKYAEIKADLVAERKLEARILKEVHMFKDLKLT